MPFYAEDAGKDAMEGAHPQLLGFLRRNERGNTFAHLAGSLVGEGQGKDIPWLQALLQKVGNFIGQDTCLPTACTCDDKRRSIDAKHRLALTVV